MDMKLAEYRVNKFIPIGLDITICSLELINKYEKLTFFNSIHIAIATTTGFTLLTSDDRIMKIVMEAEGILIMKILNNIFLKLTYSIEELV